MKSNDSELTGHDLAVDLEGDGSLDEEDVPPRRRALPGKVRNLAGLIGCPPERGLHLDDRTALIVAEAAVSCLLRFRSLVTSLSDISG